jgi:hypothetical protein
MIANRNLVAKQDSYLYSDARDLRTGDPVGNTFGVRPSVRTEDTW